MSLSSEEIDENFTNTLLDSWYCDAGNIRLFGWRRSGSGRFNVWEVDKSRRKRSEKESDRADAGVDRCRAEDLFENLCTVPRENRRRGRPGRDRAQYSSCQTLRSDAGNRI